MQALRFLFSPSGLLRPRAFIVAAIVVYAVGAVSPLLTHPDMVAHGGLWLFAAVQAVLIWVWYALHARRLRDGGRGTGLATGVAILYALQVVLLLILATAFFATSGTSLSDVNKTGALVLLVLLWVIAAVSGPYNEDLGWLIAGLATAMAYVPIILAVAVTLWAATRPSTGK
jgi:uncharacterized membrane protein YhaH (DUF805 family)